MGLLTRSIIELTNRRFAEQSLANRFQQARAVRSIALLSHPDTKIIDEMVYDACLSARKRIIDLASGLNTYDNHDNRKLYQEVALLLNTKAGIAVDVGSGSNNLPAEGLIAAGVSSVTRVDNSSQLGGEGACSPQIRRKHGDATDLPFFNGSIDLIVYNQSLSFVGEYAHKSEVGKRILAERPDLIESFEKNR